MRLPIPQSIALGIGVIVVTTVLIIRARLIRYRIARAGRLYDAGRIDEGDRTMRAVDRSVTGFYKRFPGWRRTASAEACP